MEIVNCLRCDFRHKDNGNCTAVGGFCTAVEAAHCPMLRKYLDTGLTPEQCENAKVIIESAFSDDTSKAERIRELLKADEDGRMVYGRWITKKAATGKEYTICSACDFAMYYMIAGGLAPLDIRNAKYCPNCGARMNVRE